MLIGLIIGLFLGALLGVVLMACLQIAKRSGPDYESLGAGVDRKDRR